MKLSIDKIHEVVYKGCTLNKELTGALKMKNIAINKAEKLAVELYGDKPVATYNAAKAIKHEVEIDGYNFVLNPAYHDYIEGVDHGINKPSVTLMPAMLVD